MTDPHHREAAPAPGGPSVLTLALASEAGVLVVALLLFWWTELWPHLTLDPVALLIGIGVGLACARAVAGLVGSGATLARGLWEDAQPLLERFKGATPPTLVLVAAAAGICEEALFRGAIQSWIGTWSGPHVAVLAAAVLFGLLHAVSVRYAVFATVLGMVLGYLFLLTGSLAAAMLAHGVYDFAVLHWLRRLPARRAGDGS